MEHSDARWLAERRHQFAIGGASLYIIVTLLFVKGVIHRDTWVDAFVANSFTWLCVMAFLGYGYRHLSFCNPLLRWARDASYPIYILHQAVIVAIGYYVVQASRSPWTNRNETSSQRAVAVSANSGARRSGGLIWARDRCIVAAN